MSTEDPPPGLPQLFFTQGTLDPERLKIEGHVKGIHVQVTPRKVATLTGALLDAAVAKALGIAYGFTAQSSAPKDLICLTEVTGEAGDGHRPLVWFKPSTRWVDGGPIIERERIELIPQWFTFEGAEDARWQAVLWLRPNNKDGISEFGPTALAATMRAFVVAKIGSEVTL